MTPTTIKTIIIIIFIIIFIIDILLGIIVSDFDAFGIQFLLLILVAVATFSCVCEHSTHKEYFSQEYDVDEMVKIIPKEHFKEEVKYVNSDKSPYKVLIHETLFKTDEWKLIKYIPTEDEYERFKKSNTESN